MQVDVLCLTANQVYSENLYRLIMNKLFKLAAHVQAVRATLLFRPEPSAWLSLLRLSAALIQLFRV